MTASQENSLLPPQPTGSEPPNGRWRWIFAVLILAGMILIGVSVLLILRDTAPVHASDACLRMARL
jgi:hypothetical protein